MYPEGSRRRGFLKGNRRRPYHDGRRGLQLCQGFSRRIVISQRPHITSVLVQVGFVARCPAATVVAVRSDPCSHREHGVRPPRRTRSVSRFRASSSDGEWSKQRPEQLPTRSRAQTILCARSPGIHGPRDGVSCRDVTQCSVTAGAVGDEVRLILVIGHGAIGTLDAADRDSLVD